MSRKVKTAIIFIVLVIAACLATLFKSHNKPYDPQFSDGAMQESKTSNDSAHSYMRDTEEPTVSVILEKSTKSNKHNKPIRRTGKPIPTPRLYRPLQK